MPDPDYGDRFYDWVVSEGRSASESLTVKDFKARTHHTHVRAIHSANDALSVVLAELPIITKEIQNSESTSNQMDSLKTALARKGSASSHLNRLLKLDELIRNARFSLDVLKSFNSSSEFYRKGLYHVSRESILESLRSSGDNAIKTMDGHYPFRIDVTVDGNGETRAEPSSMEWSAVSLAAYYAGPYAPVVYFLYAVYLILRDTDYQNKIRKQNERIVEAIKRFAIQEALSPDESLTIWRSELAISQARFETQILEIYNLVDQLEQSWKNAFTITVSRLDLSNAMLTQQKVESLIAQGGRLDLIDLRMTPMLFQTSREISQFSFDVTKLAITLENKKITSRSLSLWEDYTDAIREGQSVFSYLKANAFFLSLHPKIERALRTLDERSKEVDIIESKLETGTNQVFPSSKIDDLDEGMVENKLDVELGHRLFDTKELFEPLCSSNKNLTLLDEIDSEKSYIYINPSSLYLGLKFSNGRYDIVWGSHGEGQYDDHTNGRRYDDNLAGGRNASLEYLVGSYNDGGIATDNREASAKLEEFKANLATRNGDLDQAFSQLDSSLDNWFTQASKARTLQNTALKTIDQDLSIRLSFVRDELDIGKRQLVDEFLNNPFSLDEIGNTIQQLDIGGSVYKPLSLSHVRSGGASFSALDFRSSAFGDNGYGNNTQLAREHARQTAKVKRDEEKVRKRFEANRATGKQDPVFKDKESMEALFNRWGDRLREATRFGDLTGEAFARFKQGAIATSERFLKEAAELRYFARGILDSEPVPTLGPAEVELQNKEIDRTVDGYLRTSQSWSSPYACNLFIEKIAEKVWGHNDFSEPEPDLLREMGLPASITKIQNANQAITYMTLNKRRFKYIGEATSQDSLNTAGHYQNLGLMVIYGKYGGDEPMGPGGHVAVGMSGVLDQTSNTWGKIPNHPEYGKLKLPLITSFSIDHDPPDVKKIHVRKKLSWGWNSPEKVKIFVRYPDD